MVPYGAVGELYVAGVGIALGYLNQQDLTRSRFPASLPYVPHNGVAYRTGDLVRFNQDGHLIFVGRIDEQLKVSGYRIEPGEVASVLMSHPAVADALVTDWAEMGAQKQLVCYFVSRPNVPVNVGELRAFLGKKLPGFMVPSLFVALDEFPRTHNGKVDRKRLPAPKSMLRRTDGEHAPPRDSMELRLAAIWERMLGVNRIGIRDNFFELGGHSLIAVATVVEIEREFSCRLPLASFIRYPTIEELAILVRSERAGIPPSYLVPIKSTGSERPLYCVHRLGGTILIYRPLAEVFPASRPLLALEAPGLNGEVEPLETVQEVADCYVQLIREHQPQGPYLLAGASFGGIVAFEMAHQFVRMGESVPFLGIFDTSFVTGNRMAQKTRWRAARFIGGRLRKHAAALWGIPVSHWPAYIRERASSAKRALVDREDEYSQLPEAYRAVIRANERALSLYEPTAYAGSVVLFRAMSGEGVRGPDGTMGWGNVASGGVKTYDVPGNHLSILNEPNVQELARIVTKCLAEAEEQINSVTERDHSQG
jgi:thioesterase domain-containing protein/acyl carrier protein